jgi:hypothetical protein
MERGCGRAATARVMQAHGVAATAHGRTTVDLKWMFGAFDSHGAIAA